MAVTPVAASFAPSAPDWRHATRSAAGLLVELGTAPQDYPGECVAAVEEHGPYIVLAPGVALVHARQGAGLAEGLALLRLAEPVEFGHPGNDPVDVLLAFSSSGGHMAMIKALASGLSAGLADRLRQAQDTAQARRVLSEVLDGAEEGAG